jgi:hypothetical protein
MLPFFALAQSEQPKQEWSEPFEVRLTKPPEWVAGCLSLSLDRINRSSAPLFLPDMGLYIATSVREVGDQPAAKNAQNWINVYGASDLVSWSAKEIAPSATVHIETCLDPEVAVVSLERRTRRMIPLRGKLRIDAYYYSTEEDWKAYESYHHEMMRTPPVRWNELVRASDPKVVTVYAAIPCREPRCGPVCDDPPQILHGEKRMIPDVGYIDPARGKAIGDELESKSPACGKPAEVRP